MMKGTFRNLGSHLKEKRKKADFTQAGLAQALGLHSQFVSNWERGVCEPPTHAKKRLCKLLSLKSFEILEAELADEKARIQNRLKKEWGFK